MSCDDAIHSEAALQAFLDFAGPIADWYRPVHAVLSIVLSVFAVVANIVHVRLLSLYQLCQMRRRQMINHYRILCTKSMRSSSFSFLLMMIAVCDVGTVLGTILVTMARPDGCNSDVVSDADYCDCIHDNYNTYRAQLLIYSPWFVVWMHSAALWLCVGLAAVRYFTLRKVQLQSPWLGLRRAGQITGLVLGGTLIMSLPCLFMMQVAEIVEEVFRSVKSADGGPDVCVSINSETLGNYSLVYLSQEYNDTVVLPPLTIYVTKLSEFAQGNNCMYYRVSMSVINGVLFKFLPCVILTVLTVLLTKRLSSITKHRKNMKATPTPNASTSQHTPKPKSTGSANDTTVLIIGVAVVFVITELPQGLMNVYSGLSMDQIFDQVYNKVFGDFLDLASLLNLCLHLILSMCLAPPYRRAAHSLASEYGQSISRLINWLGINRFCCCRADQFEQSTDQSASIVINNVKGNGNSNNNTIRKYSVNKDCNQNENELRKALVTCSEADNPVDTVVVLAAQSHTKEQKTNTVHHHKPLGPTLSDEEIVQHFDDLIHDKNVKVAIQSV